MAEALGRLLFVLVAAAAIGFAWPRLNRRRGFSVLAMVVGAVVVFALSAVGSAAR